MRHVLLLYPLFYCFSVAASAEALKPWAAVFVDYIPSESSMIGVTIAPYHYDEPYNRWGFYLGYAKSRDQDAHLAAPSEGHYEQSMFRLGLSYSLSEDLSWYSGAAYQEQSLHHTNGIMPLIVGGEPEWLVDTQRQWGGELGLRYALTRHFIVSTGYNSVTESWLLGIGYRG